MRIFRECKGHGYGYGTYLNSSSGNGYGDGEKFGNGNGDGLGIGNYETIYDLGDGFSSGSGEKTYPYALIQYWS